MFKVTPYEEKAVKEICWNCGSPEAKKSFNYFRRIHYLTQGKVWSKEDTPVAFYYAMRCHEHCRLIEIAVRKEFQGRGIGRTILFALLLQMKTANLRRLTFRTPMSENAKFFWMHMGARILDVKQNDFEMELNIQ